MSLESKADNAARCEANEREMRAMPDAFVNLSDFPFRENTGIDIRALDHRLVNFFFFASSTKSFTKTISMFHVVIHYYFG